MIVVFVLTNAAAVDVGDATATIVEAVGVVAEDAEIVMVSSLAADVVDATAGVMATVPTPEVNVKTQQKATLPMLHLATCKMVAL